ncbi:rCG44709 [Rattus norvegicus]|uniref:RCG44709 n=1 Tax=Rattus norvegicus TaxID=10116 RepID=A6I5H3_RAT|nr:rCG44709 [Rattus norvegicus]
MMPCLVSECLIKQTMHIPGPCLNNLGKSPSSLTCNENMAANIEEVKSMIKYHVKMQCLTVVIGHLKMTDNELIYKIHLAGNSLVFLLKTI